MEYLWFWSLRALRISWHFDKLLLLNKQHHFYHPMCHEKSKQNLHKKNERKSNYYWCRNIQLCWKSVETLVVESSVFYTSSLSLSIYISYTIYTTFKCRMVRLKAYDITFYIYSYLNRSVGWAIIWNIYISIIYMIHFMYRHDILRIIR